MTPEEETAFIERIADAVIRRIDEREKIALLADAVLDRLAELGVHADGSRRDHIGAVQSHLDQKEEPASAKESIGEAPAAD